MSFRLVPNSVTLNDLERRNSPNRLVIWPNLVAFEADYVKVIGLHFRCRKYWRIFNHLYVIRLESYQILSATEM